MEQTDSSRKDGGWRGQEEINQQTYMHICITLDTEDSEEKAQEVGTSGRKRMCNSQQQLQKEQFKLGGSIVFVIFLSMYEIFSIPVNRKHHN